VIDRRGHSKQDHHVSDDIYCTAWQIDGTQLLPRHDKSVLLDCTSPRAQMAMTTRLPGQWSIVF